MKIAFLAFNFLPNIGGAQIFTYNVAKRLAERGHELCLYVPRTLYRRFKELEISCPFKVRSIFCMENEIFSISPGLLSGMIKLKQLVGRYDVWQVVGAYPAGYCAMGLRGVPVVLRTHGTDIQKDEKLNYGDRLNPEKERLIKTTLNGAEKLVALTSSVVECYRELGVPEDKIVEIPNGISVSRFRQETDRAGTRRLAGVGPDEKFILTVGRYHVKKGYELIPDAAEKLSQKGIKFKWLIVGSGTDVLKELVEKKDMSDRIILKEEVGFGHDLGANNFDAPSEYLLKIYKAADIFVLPSYIETFGMVLIEAMAAGLPVVTTDAPGCRDVVKGGENGLAVNCGDAKGIAEAVENLISDGDLAAGLLARAEKLIGRYDWECVTDEYEKLYMGLTGK